MGQLMKGPWGTVGAIVALLAMVGLTSFGPRLAEVFGR
jgi:hypothetical protein